MGRTTSRGVPWYLDGDEAGAAADTFVLSGVEHLVPVPGAAAGRRRFCPRTEGLFARIEHVRDATGDYWKVRG